MSLVPLATSLRSGELISGSTYRRDFPMTQATLARAAALILIGAIGIARADEAKTSPKKPRAGDPTSVSARETKVLLTGATKEVTGDDDDKKAVKSKKAKKGGEDKDDDDKKAVKSKKAKKGAEDKDDEDDEKSV